MSSVERQLQALLLEVREMVAGDPAAAAAVEAMTLRLNRPMRVALAGRVKAGKSTLLNALLRELLAPTDAGECTRLVTRYEFADDYRVTAHAADGSTRGIPFRREEGRLAPALDDDDGSIIGLTVGWPSSRLRRTTLIDTPGLGSIRPELSARTDAALAGDGHEADALIYLLKHAHESDSAFLQAFNEDATGPTRPVNTIAVLSRPDEIGGARLDSMTSAARIAARYEGHERLRQFASVVVPVSGLLAETAGTLQEREAHALRMLAAEDQTVLRRMTLAVDLFREPGASMLTVETREELLTRFGLFGLRIALRAYAERQWDSAASLAEFLQQTSGLPRLEAVISERFGGRARQLVARSVLSELRTFAESRLSGGSSTIARQVEAIEAGAHEFAELEMLDLVLSGEVRWEAGDVLEVERLTGGESMAVRAGSDPNATGREIQAAAIASAARWRERASDARGAADAWCAIVVVRIYEGIFLDAGEGS